jgi:hypothetical protein
VGVTVRPVRRVATWGLVLAGVLTGIGCSDDGNDGSDDGPADTAVAATAETTEPAPGTCPFVTVEALTEAFAQPIEPIEVGARACDYFVGEAVSVQLSLVDGQLDPEAFYDQGLGRCAGGSVVEVEAGDRAYACVAMGPAAAVARAGVVVSILTTGIEDETAGRDALATLLPRITVPG